MGHYVIWLTEKEYLKETETATDRCSLKIVFPKSKKNKKY